MDVLVRPPRQLGEAADEADADADDDDDTAAVTAGGVQDDDVVVLVRLLVRLL